MKDKNLFITSIIFLVIYFFFIIGIFSPLEKFFIPIITTFTFVYFLYPVVDFLKKFRIHPVISTLLIYSLIIICLCFAILFAIPTVYEAVIKIIEIFNQYLSGLKINITNIFSAGAEKAYATAMNILKIGVIIVVGAASAFYILTGKERIINSLKEFVPEKLKPSFKILLDDIKASLDSFFKGQFLIAFILFVMDTVFLYLAGVPYAIGLGAIAAILDIVPYVGATVGVGVIIVVTLVSCPERILIIIIGLLTIQQIENNIISPKISADSLSLHPSVTVLVLYMGAFGGFWGILLAIPLTSILCKLFRRLIQSIM